MGDAAPTPEHRGRLFLTGLAINLGNPKVIVFFFALLPTVVDLRALGIASTHRPFTRLSTELLRITWGALLTGLFGEPGAAMEMLERASAVGGDIWPQVSCREIVFQMSLLSPYYFSEVAGFNEVMSVPADARAKI